MTMEWIAPLAASAATALVTAAATDAWATTRAGFARLLGRGDPQRTALVESRLDEIAQTPEPTRQELVVPWRTRLEDLLAEDDTHADELRRLIALVPSRGPAVAYQTGAVTVLGAGPTAVNTGVVSGDIVVGPDGRR